MSKEEILFYVILAGIATAIITVAVTIYFLTRRKYFLRPSMMSESENYFFALIEQMLPQGYRLVPQVPFAVILSPRKGRKYTSRFNRISAKRADYCICRESRLSVFPFFLLETVAVIELDDRSHRRRDRVKRDNFINKICAKCGLPMLRFELKPGKKPDYDEREIYKRIISAIR